MSSFLLIGNRLCIDFANTAIQSGGPLENWDDFQLFMAESSRSSETGWRDGDGYGGGAEEAFALAVELRSAIRGLLAALAEERQVPADHIDVINRVLALRRGAERLDHHEHGWHLHFAAEEVGAAAALVPIARSAAELLAEGASAPVRCCADPRCGLMFYDTSRTRRRRWCRMSACGNRSKVARYFMRHEARL
ncbi:MAG: ABATE domain-containing protein [Dongiaceae bacterium]